MRRLTAFFKLDQISFLILVLPYLAFSLPLFAESPFFSLPKFLLTLAVIFLVDVLVKLFLKRYQGATLLTALLIYSGVLLLLYSPYLLLPVINVIHKHFPVSGIRGRGLFVVLLALIALLVLMTRKKKQSFNHIVNIFMLILFALNLCSTALGLHSKKRTAAPSTSAAKNISPDTKDSLDKPIILLITDEYSSPDELYTLFRDSSLYDFSRQLKQTGWIVRQRSYSLETSTIHSLSSLFNFNLSENRDYGNSSFSAVSVNLLHCKLGDSLEKKNIGIINFGILDINGSKPLSRLYPYPKSYLDALSYNSVLTLINMNTGSMNPAGFGADFNAISNHNRKIFENLNDSLGRLRSNNNFIYAHLLMPHIPFSYFDEINEPATTAGYLAYWKFANKKVTQLLQKLLQSGKYRIILTGDHGYRGDPKKINPQYTATAFGGFGEKDIEKISSVQDLGALINAYLK